MDSDVAGDVARSGRSKSIPGEVGIWLFILGDLIVFSLFFGNYLYDRSLDVELFSRSQATLSQSIGTVNTLVLLASSWFVVKGLHAVRVKAVYPGRWFAAAWGCGLIFSINKLVEYVGKARVDIGAMTNDFYMYYFVLTGIHFVHVLVGMALLMLMRNVAVKATRTAGDARFLETGASFWHVVDVLWIVLFPLLYLIH
jgi:nitric oxide reductase NorE protein